MPANLPSILAGHPALLRDLVLSNRILAHEGVVDAFGHVSIRHPDHPDRFVISRSLGPELVTEDDLQLFGLDGKQVGGDERAPYGERFIHAAVYEARPDVQAVCHNHAPSVIPFSVTGVPLRPIFHIAATIGAEIPVWDIADDFGDTNMLVLNVEQGRSLARTLGDRRVALMRGHGSVVASWDVRYLTGICIYLERNAELLARALALGTVRYLSEGEVERAGARTGGSLNVERAWTTWCRRIGEQ